MSSPNELREALRSLAEANTAKLEEMLRWAPVPYRVQLQRALARTEPVAQPAPPTSSPPSAPSQPTSSSSPSTTPANELYGDRCRGEFQFVLGPTDGEFAAASCEGKLGAFGERDVEVTAPGGAPSVRACAAELAEDALSSGRSSAAKVGRAAVARTVSQSVGGPLISPNPCWGIPPQGAQPKADTRTSSSLRFRHVPHPCRGTPLHTQAQGPQAPAQVSSSQQMAASPGQSGPQPVPGNPPFARTIAQAGQQASRSPAPKLARTMRAPFVMGRRPSERKSQFATAGTAPRSAPGPGQVAGGSWVPQTPQTQKVGATSESDPAACSGRTATGRSRHRSRARPRLSCAIELSSWPPTSAAAQGTGAQSQPLRGHKASRQQAQRSRASQFRAAVRAVTTTRRQTCPPGRPLDAAEQAKCSPCSHRLRDHRISTNCRGHRRSRSRHLCELCRKETD